MAGGQCVTGKVEGEEGRGAIMWGLVGQRQVLGFHSKGIWGPPRGLFKKTTIRLK